MYCVTNFEDKYVYFYNFGDQKIIDGKVYDKVKCFDTETGKIVKEEWKLNWYWESLRKSGVLEFKVEEE